LQAAETFLAEKKMRKMKLQFVLVLISTVAVSTPAYAGIFDFLFGKRQPSQPRYAPPPAPPTDNWGMGSEDGLPPGIDLSYHPIYAWPITQIEWTFQDEQEYSAWVQTLGKSGCASLTDCLESDANYLKTQGEVVRLYTDCADLPYQLRGYFSWKKGLPFSYQDSMMYRLDGGVKPQDSGMQMSTNGNYPTHRTEIRQKSATDMYYANRVLHFLSNVISSGHMRLDPTAASMNQRRPGEVADDFYSVTIQRGSIRPGTVMYNPSGHVGVVYDILKDGTIKLFNAHPAEKDKVSRRIIGNPYGSLSRTYFGPSELSLSRLTHGHGFKNFRPFRLMDAQPGYWTHPYTGQRLNVWVGGTVRFYANEQIADFSLEQFNGNVPGSRETAFAFQGIQMGYFEYVRTAMKGDLRVEPVTDMSRTVEGVCQLAKNRAKVVNDATQMETHLRAHPERLPNNIFTALTHKDDNALAAEWEKNSTSSRDVRFRRAILEIRNRANQLMQMSQSENPLIRGRLEYRGRNLQADLSAAYQSAVNRCSIQYLNSDGKNVSLSLRELIDRAILISDDPYLCPELRWGAKNSRELASCAEARDPNGVKMRWYNATQRFRNKLETSNSWDMNYTLEDLENATKNGDESVVWGTNAAPVISAFGVLE